MLKSFLDRNFRENSPSDLLIFGIVLISSLVLLILLNRIVVRGIRKRAIARDKTGSPPPSLEIERKTLPILYCVAMYFSLQVLTLGAEVAKAATALFFVGLGFFSVRLAISLVEILADRRWAKEDENGTRLKTIKAVFAVFKIAIWAIAIFVLLDNLGVNLTALLAGLGIGGIALALAAQTILGDLFSCFVIYIDRPFEVGDFVSVDSFSGTIQHIGIKTTRIRSLSGEQLIFSNSDLTTSRLRNYQRMEKRRISFKLGVAYDTAAEGLKLLPDLLGEIIRGIPDTEFERAHFSAYGDYSLVFEVVYYVTTSDYLRYMDIQQEINLEIKERVEKAGIKFAYPTQSLLVNMQR